MKQLHVQIVEGGADFQKVGAPTYKDNGKMLIVHDEFDNAVWGYSWDTMSAYWEDGGGASTNLRWDLHFCDAQGNAVEMQTFYGDEVKFEESFLSLIRGGSRVGRANPKFLRYFQAHANK